MKRKVIVSFLLCWACVLPMQAQRFNVYNDDGVKITYLPISREEPFAVSVTYEGAGRQYNVYDTVRVPATVTWRDTVWNVTDIYQYAFAECRSLKCVELPESITHLGSFAFACTGIVSFRMPGSVTSVGMLSFFGNEQLVDITLSPHLTALSKGMFSNCHRLRFLRVPESVITIDTQAVLYCSILDRISLPASLQEIKHMAFADNISLSAITVHALVPPAVEGSDVFARVDRESTVLHVPAGCLEAYRAAPVWSEFLDIRDDAVGIASAAAAPLRWHVEKHAIVVESTQAVPVTLYDAMGRQLLHTTLPGSQRIPVPHSGLYILRHGNRSSKIVVP